MNEPTGVAPTAGEIDAALERAFTQLRAALDPAGASRVQLVPPGSSVLVACSGGADSMALAAALCTLQQSRPELNLRVALGHVDHQLRADSVEDSERVRALAQTLEVPFFVEQLDLPALQSAIARQGLEGAAREFRYAALERLAVRAECELVATAHTRRDQAETVLLRLARGGGLGALAGIRTSRALGSRRLIRPLLGVSRAATEAYCRARSLPFSDDPHNRDPARTRARVRTAFATLAELLNPRLEQALAASAAMAAEEDALLDALARAALLAAAVQLPDHVAPSSTTLRVSDLAPLPDAILRRVLLLCANAAGTHPERVHVEAVTARVRFGQGSLELPGGHAALAGGLLSFHRGRAPILGADEVPAAAPLVIEGRGHFAWGHFTLEVRADVDASIADAPIIDLARAPFPWTLRAHAAGDRFRPARGHLKKVSDLWIDAKFPRQRRATAPLLADATGALFFVAGLRAGEASLSPHKEPLQIVLRSAEASEKAAPVGPV